MANQQDNEEQAELLLLLVSESHSVRGQVRSRDRDVRSWVDDGDGAVGTVGTVGAGTFSGDPTDPATYTWTRSADGVTAVIDLQPPSRARAALAALREVRADAAVLLLSDEQADREHDGTLVRAGELRNVLRLDIDEELQRLEAERRVFCLREWAAGADVLPILIHNDPDPDAVSSALGLALLLDGSPERTPIVTLGGITRPENRRMVDLLHIRVTEITVEELRRFERVVCVDTQPRELQRDGHPRVAVIDHHPHESTYQAEFCDVRPHYGAAATMITEYLRSDQRRRVSRSLATALLYGIKTDTDSLMRGVTPADVEAYAHLQERADLQLLRRFERPSYRAGAARAFGEALTRLVCDDELCVAYIGELEPLENHVLADLADFCLSIENVTWAVTAARIEERLVLTLRHTGTGVGAGAVAQRLAELGGSGGGHATMARVSLDESGARTLRADAEAAGMGEAIRRLVRAALAEEGDASRPESRPAPRA